MLSGTVFDIQRCCVHDGPGIRTTVFLKGCPQHCFWCHNPESIAPQKQLMFFHEKCIQCHACEEACSHHAHRIKDGNHVFDRSLCVGCGECAKKCFADALVMSGKTMTTKEVMEEILKDTSFYEASGGGVTFSGGEPLLQTEFLEELLKACKSHNLPTAIETAGNVSWDRIERVASYTDLFLYDIKAMDGEVHKRAVGLDNRLALDNLEKLICLGKQVRIRVPVIPGVNDTEDAMKKIASFAARLSREVRIELLAFHKMGRSKYESLGMVYQAEQLEPPDEEKMKRLKEVLGSQSYEKR